MRRSNMPNTPQNLELQGSSHITKPKLRRFRKLPFTTLQWNYQMIQCLTNSVSIRQHEKAVELLGIHSSAWCHLSSSWNQYKRRDYPLEPSTQIPQLYSPNRMPHSFILFHLHLTLFHYHFLQLLLADPEMPLRDQHVSSPLTRKISTSSSTLSGNPTLLLSSGILSARGKYLDNHLARREGL